MRCGGRRGWRRHEGDGQDESGPQWPVFKSRLSHQLCDLREMAGPQSHTHAMEAGVLLAYRAGEWVGHTVGAQWLLYMDPPPLSGLGCRESSCQARMGVMLLASVST